MDTNRISKERLAGMNNQIRTITKQLITELIRTDEERDEDYNRTLHHFADEVGDLYFDIWDRDFERANQSLETFNPTFEDIPEPEPKLEYSQLKALRFMASNQHDIINKVLSTTLEVCAIAYLNDDIHTVTHNTNSIIELLKRVGQTRLYLDDLHKHMLEYLRAD